MDPVKVADVVVVVVERDVAVEDVVADVTLTDTLKLPTREYRVRKRELRARGRR